MQKSTWPLMIEQAFVFNPTWGRSGLSFPLLAVHFYTIMNGGSTHFSCVHWPMLFHNRVVTPTISSYLFLGTATLPTIMLMLCRSESESGMIGQCYFTPKPQTWHADLPEWSRFEKLTKSRATMVNSKLLVRSSSRVF